MTATVCSQYYSRSYLTGSQVKRDKVPKTIFGRLLQHAVPKQPATLPIARTMEKCSYLCVQYYVDHSANYCTVL